MAVKAAHPRNENKLPQISPFKAVRYNTKKIKDLSSVIAPPYDIIPNSMQEALYRAHPRNIVRLILGKIYPRDTAGNNRYTRAKKFLDEWTRENILIKDEAPAIYIYSQRYLYGRKPIERVGFMALMDIGAGKENKVRPHENTLAAPKIDRLNLIKNIRANLSPIFVLYDDRHHKVLNILKRSRAKHKPIIDLSFEGVRNRVWALSNPGDISRIQNFLKRKETFIADGHHRFEVARMYARKFNGPAHMLVYFVESDEKMLTILPAHRLLKDIGGLKKRAILEKISRYFDIEKSGSLKGLIRRLDSLADSHAFGLYLGGGDFRLIVLKDVKKSDRAIKAKPKAWKRLDVSILHFFLFRKVLVAKDDDDNVEFVKDPEEAVKLVDSGKCRVAFFLNPTKASEVKRIAKLGERMPRKATYFYPKPLSGLVINKH